MVSDGAKTFFKLFSLRGGGHYLPCGFRFSSSPLPFQRPVLMMGSHSVGYILALVVILKCPFEKELYIEIHLTLLMV